MNEVNSDRGSRSKKTREWRGEKTKSYYKVVESWDSRGRCLGASLPPTTHHSNGKKRQIERWTKRREMEKKRNEKEKQRKGRNRLPTTTTQCFERERTGQLETYSGG